MPSLLKTPCDTGNFLEILRPFGIKVAPGNLEFKNYCEMVLKCEIVLIMKEKTYAKF